VTNTPSILDGQITGNVLVYKLLDTVLYAYVSLSKVDNTLFYPSSPL
jgi:hypothetical protein